MHRTPAPSDAPFDVVLLGSGLGIYALSRAFHEAYGVVSTVVAVGAPEPFRRSITCQVHDLPSGSTDEDRLKTLLALAEARGYSSAGSAQSGSEDSESAKADDAKVTGSDDSGVPGTGRREAAQTGGAEATYGAEPGISGACDHGRPAVLMCNTDGDIAFIARHADALAPYYVLRLPDLTTVERLSDKAEFTALCGELGIDAPRTLTLDFRNGQRPEIPHIDAGFPVVAKPAVSEPHVRLRMDGKKKVYFLSDEGQLRELVDRLYEAGFRDRFVVQELIPGDDTYMRSITAYRDARGVVTLAASAAVLLEEHTPDALGRPAAMLTHTYSEALTQARAILEATQYIGFANFDIKEDPRTGTLHFLEVNPRIGRNSFYVTGAGANIARFIVEDGVFNRAVEPVFGVPEILYSMVPTGLLMRYVTDPEQRRHVRAIAHRGVVDPWLYKAEGAWMRTYARVTRFNHVRKFLKYYPRPTSTGF
ncbi:carboxylate--amine ligase [Devriesea agamarum]|uniref:carboxylate--amine ligase n=1 Tax=Devriesea agamarum TaxID=472569 RepID=UPI00071DF008|nr:hypothetical protein [Devriesea agamarum]